MEARVRRATVDDAAAIAAIHVETWRVAYAHVFSAEYLEGLSVDDRLDLWAQTLDGGTFDVFVAQLGDRVAGFVSSGRAEDPAAPGELFALYVLPDAWGHGLGRALLEHAETALRAGGYDAAVLWVLEDNPRARCPLRGRGMGRRRRQEAPCRGWRLRGGRALPQAAVLTPRYSSGCAKNHSWPCGSRQP